MASDLGAGAVFHGKFRIVREIGRGGMATVVEAVRLEGGSHVAVKILLPEVRHMQGMVERFVREARAVARMRNEHVTRVFDVDVDSSGAPYIVMELLEGSTLADVLQQRGALSISDSVDYVLQAL